jgi:putative transcriptional regulator
MDKTDFDGIMRGLKEAKAFLKGEPVAVRVHIPAKIDVAAIRERSGLSQAAFAGRVGVPAATLRNWEQGRRVPDGSARVLLAMLAKNPRIVEETLSPNPRPLSKHYWTGPRVQDRKRAASGKGKKTRV